MIDKWLKAGSLQDGLLRHTTEGSPSGRRDLTLPLLIAPPIQQATLQTARRANLKSKDRR
jgi:hypothetical protein